MSENPRISGEAFALARLRDNPDLDYDALRIAGEAAGVPLLPIQFGRARRQLGLANGSTQPQQLVQGEATDGDPGTMQMAAGAEAAVQPAPVPGPGLSRPSTPAFEFLVEELRAEPAVSYGQLKLKADAQGLKIAPIMYGRAKALLGLVPVRPRGQGKNRKKSPVAKLPRAEAASAEQFSKQIETVRNVDDLIAIVKQLDDERRQLRTALRQIAQQINEALS